MHRIYLISQSPHQTPFGQMLRVWTCLPVRLHSGPAVLWGQGEAGGAGQRCPIRDCPGELGGVCGWPASSRVPRPPLILGTVYRQSVSRHRAGGPPYPFPFNLFSFPCLPPCPQGHWFLSLLSPPSDSHVGLPGTKSMPLWPFSAEHEMGPSQPVFPTILGS